MQLARSASPDEAGMRIAERLTNRGREEATFGLWSVRRADGQGSA